MATISIATGLTAIALLVAGITIGLGWAANDLCQELKRRRAAHTAGATSTDRR